MKSPSVIRIQESSPTSDAAVTLTDALSARPAALTGDKGRSNYRPKTVGSRGCYLLAIDGDSAVGCGALRPLEDGGRDDVGKFKRMYAKRTGAGIGIALQRALQARAWLFGYRTIVLETRKVNVVAVAFYSRHGYAVTEKVGP